jgi:hypothetical protein
MPSPPVEGISDLDYYITNRDKYERYGLDLWISIALYEQGPLSLSQLFDVYRSDIKAQEYNYFYSKKDLKGALYKMKFDKKVHFGKYDHLTKTFEGYYVNPKVAFRNVKGLFFWNNN